VPNREELVKQLNISISSRTPIITIESFEWERVQGAISASCREQKFDYFKWNYEDGLRVYNMKSKKMVTNDDRLKDAESLTELSNIMTWFKDEYPNPAVLHLEDYHHFFNQDSHRDAIDRELGPHPPWASMWLWRNIARMKANKNKCVILSGPIFEPTSDLQKEVSHLKLDYPDIEDLRKVYARVCRNHEFNQEGMDSKEVTRVIESARGMTIMEASTAFSQSGYGNGKRLDLEAIPSIIRHKRSILRNSGGLLDYFEPNVDMDDVGGLDNIKSWLVDRENDLTPEAREYGIEPPKGLLLMGVPGCGKSMVSKAIAAAWNYPLVRFDLSRVFGRYVGDSEKNMRTALDVAEAVAPCILWIDEIEKGMSGVGSSGNLDSGTTARTMGSLLTWMQEKTSPVFVVATLNKLSLPPESIRKGRFDEIFFVDLPSKKVRRDILQKKIDKLGVPSGSCSSTIDLDSVVDVTDLFSGAELEQCVKDSLRCGFNDGRRPLNTEDLLEICQSTIPLAITMEEDINKMREFCRNRAKLADSVEMQLPTSEGVEKNLDEKYEESDFDN
jgi:ATP-dependent 26S proteasome regulatory subunit